MRLLLLLLALLTFSRLTAPAMADDAKDTEALRQKLSQAIAGTLAQPKPDRDGIVTASEANIYAQCRQSPLLTAWRCETAGIAMQPSLRLILSRKRQDALSELGLQIDETFGNFAMNMPTDTDPEALADILIRALIDGYGADPGKVKVDARYLPTQTCPIRTGWTQSDAGAINIWPSMKSVSGPFCNLAEARQPPQDMGAGSEASPGPPIPTPANQRHFDIVTAYTPAVARELARIRTADTKDDPWFILDTAHGYVQCAPDDDQFYCEAASAESVPELKPWLTPERKDVLHKAGYEDPGRHQNYVAHYPYKSFGDVKVAVLLLSVLRDVYGYDGATLLRAVDAQHAKGRILATE
ncbi:MAG TPA: hypothetical protein VL574_16545 [Stellaceae bacterium]|nr:hypothetical protein [Stellaceae bacterium]